MNRANKAVSETVGTMLLLGISIALFSVVYISVLTIYPSDTSPSVNIIFSVDENNTNITIEHCGGKELDLDTEISITIDEANEKFSVGDYLSNESKNNGAWNAGERVKYPVEDITDKNVLVSVIDKVSNSVIMTIGFQEGEY
jgi:FlaG/FlaF family flagellin (archaellin)